jgi:GTPase Era involved in 16S rRNA processing
MATTKLERRNVIVVGKTGAGKSTVANKISGHSNFKVDNSLESVTHQVSHTEVNVVDPTTNVHYVFKIIDTIGFFNTKISNKDVFQKIKTYFQEKVPEGINLVLLVFKQGRFTKEEKKTFDFLRENFQNNISNASALTITNCDELDVEGRQNVIQDFRRNKGTGHTAKFMRKGIYAVGFPELKGMKPKLVKVYKEEMKVDEEILTRLVMNSSKMYLSKEMFEQSFWDKLSSCTIL